MHIIADIYRSTRKEGAYLYVSKAKGLDAVPDALLKPLGPLAFSMTLGLHPKRQLARADINNVLESLDTQGFYLQLPPVNVPDVTF